MGRACSCLLVAALSLSFLGVASAEPPEAASPTDVELSGETPPVSAAELVKTIVDEEKKIDEVRSLYLRFEGKWTKSLGSIAARTAELKKQYPELEITPDKFRELRAETPVALELAFDEHRVRHSERLPDENTLKIWDGSKATSVYRQLPSNEESYVFDRDPKRDIGMFFFVHLQWLRTARHLFWFRNDLGHPDPCGSPTDYAIIGTRDFRGRRCWVLENRRANRRLYVGCDDRRLYGHAAIVNPGGESYLDDYQEISPGFWCPVRQGRTSDTFESDSPSSRFDLVLLESKVNEPLADELFAVELKDGVEVNSDWRYDPPLHFYKYKANRTQEEWQAILDESKQRYEQEKKEVAVKLSARDALVGQPAPDLPALGWNNSEPLTWESLRGKVVVMHFCCPSCGPSKFDLPFMQRIHLDSKDSGIVALGIHVAGGTQEEFEKGVKEFGLEYPILQDARPPEGRLLFERFAIREFGCVFVIDQDGRIAAHGRLEEMVHKARELARRQTESK